MDYADSLRQVLIRKIAKAERDLVQLKLDYCRFVFGISHRSRVKVGDALYLVRAVDVESMQTLEGGEFGRPAVSGIPIGTRGPVTDSDLIALGREWEAVPESESLAGRSGH